MILFAIVNFNISKLSQVSKRLLHRPTLVFHNPSLQIIDGVTITDEERTKADIYFMDHQQQSVMLASIF